MRHVDPYLDELNRRFPRRQPEPPYRYKFWRDLLILLIIAFFICVIAAVCQAQTISPVVVEAKGPRVKGELSLTNDQLIPMAVVIEAQSMSVAVSGVPLYRHLDPGIGIRLTDTSARLGPKQTYRVGYEIQCASLPCVVNLAAIFTGLHTKDGLAIALHLPHVIYICQKQKGCRDSVRAGWGLK